MKKRKWFLWISFFLLPITLNYFSPVLIVQAGFERTFSIMHIVYGIMLIAAIFLGATWCSYICPFGALQEILPTDTNRKIIKPRLKYLKMILGSAFFIIIVVVPFYLQGFNKFILFYHMEDTKVTVDSLHGIVLYYIITMSITIITIIFGKRFWCRYLCPMYVFNYIGMAIRNIFRLPFLGMRIDSSKCVECKKCNNACMMALPVSDMVRSNMWEYSECIMCGECINNCSKKVIRKGISK